jgi:hypothetical protein
LAGIREARATLIAGLMAVMTKRSGSTPMMNRHSSERTNLTRLLAGVAGKWPVPQ